MIFTYDNHLDYYDEDINILDCDEFKIKMIESENYILKGRKLYIDNIAYEQKKINDDYKEDFNNFFFYILDSNKKIINYLDNYNHNMHFTFLNYEEKKYFSKLDNEELIEQRYIMPDINDIIQYDLSKAYYNVCYMPFYHGIPSKNLVLHKLINFSYNDFKKQLDNNIIGFYTIKITKINDERLKIFGFSDGTYHLLTSILITLLINYCEVEFLYGLYSVTDKKPLYTPKHLDITKTTDNKEITLYKKYNGMLLKSYEEETINIKTNKMSQKFISYCTENKYEMYKNTKGASNEYILKRQKENYVYTSYVGYYIHSYVNYKIISTVLKMKDIKNLYMIKLDSIACHKSEKFIFDNYFRDETEKIKQKYANNDLNNFFTHGLEGSEMFKTSEDFINNLNDLDIKEINLGENNINYLHKNIIFCNGKGGSGKTYNICSNFTDILYIAHCWDLCAKMKEEHKNILKAVTPHRILDNKGNKYFECDNIDTTPYKIIVIDELTLLSEDIIYKLLDVFKNNFVFLIGDIAQIGKLTFNFQVGLSENSFNYDNKKHQLINYVKNYRFDENLNNKLDILRQLMIDNYKSIYRNDIIKKKVLELFKDRIFDYDKIIYDDKTYGLVSINEINNKYLDKYYNGKDTLTNYYSKKDNIYKFYIYQTCFKKGIFKGRYTDQEQNGISTNLLFNTVHSFQGKTINIGEKLIFDISKITDYQILYTGLSRIKNEDQLYLIQYCN